MSSSKPVLLAVFLVLFSACSDGQEIDNSIEVPPPHDEFESPYFLEPIKETLSNLRGANYHPVFTELEKNKPIEEYVNGSTTSWWRFMDHSDKNWEDMEFQLKLLRETGLNILRVFVSAPVWEVEGEQFLGKLHRFIQLALKYGLHLELVLFDDFSPVGKDMSDTPYEDLDFWHRVPGLDAEKKAEASTRFHQYVVDVVNVASLYPNVLMFDIMNEPGLHLEGTHEFIAWVAELIKKTNPSAKVSVGFAAVLDGIGIWENRIAKYNTNVDYNNFHPYSIFSEGVRTLATEARRVTPRVGYASETSARDLGQPLYKAIEQAQENELGFSFWMAFFQDDHIPYSSNQGLYNAKGEARDLKDVLAIRDLARVQCPECPLRETFNVIEDDAGFISLLPKGYSEDDFKRDMHADVWYNMPKFEDDPYVYALKVGMLRALSSFGIGAFVDYDRSNPRNFLSFDQQDDIGNARALFQQFDLLDVNANHLYTANGDINWDAYETLVDRWYLTIHPVLESLGLVQ